MKDKKKVTLYLLSLIADLNFQKEVWVEQSYWHQAFSFGETVNLLEDYYFFDDIENGVLKFTDPEKQSKLEEFVKDLMAFEEPGNRSQILSDPNWIRITKEAEEQSVLLNDLMPEDEG